MKRLCSLKIFLTFALGVYVNGVVCAQPRQFVEKGKTWHFIYYAPIHYLTEEHSYDSPTFTFDYKFREDADTVIAGKPYAKMYENNAVLGYYREESGKVYCYSAISQKEDLQYDFTLNSGDIFSTNVYERDAEFDVKETGYIKVNGIDYRTQTLLMRPIEELGNETSQTTWIEGIGNLDSPEPINVPTVGGGKFILTYVTNELTGDYFPLPFTDRHLRGQQLVLGKESEGETENLEYEFINDTLHVFGTMMTGCTPNQYIYCSDDKDGIITFKTVEMPPYADCRALHQVDMYFAGFGAGNYHIGEDDAIILTCKPNAADGITDIKLNSNENSTIFTLQGIKLASPQKGLNIIGGKKVLIP